jgi:mannose-6-phosphate isomerase-like protein (cupin superfamily)
MEQGIFLEPGEGLALSARGSSMLFKAVAGTTSGAFSLMERKLPVSNRRPQAHRHQGPEGFYVLEGSIEFVLGNRSRIGGPGFWALVPGGVAHTFGNTGESPARLLIIHAPAADA